MPRKRNPKRDEAYQIWLKSKGNKLLKDIAKEVGVASSTLRKWKSQDNWDNETKRSAPNKKERYEAMKDNQNAKGNPGGKAPPGNKNAVTHGLFAKWLPEETKEIMDTLQDRNEADMLWDSIMFQYTAIIRAQKIMFVTDQDDMSKELKKEKESLEFQEKEYEIQFAWDKQERFLNAQSRALSTLSNLIKQFSILVDERDERAEKLKLMKANVKLLDLKAREQEYDEEVEDDGFLKALEDEAGALWEDE